jgi:ribulose 1,5-bisphosphate carboxylase large subunit-like protein
VAVAARGARHAKRQGKKAGQVTLRALDQSSRYADLSLDEEKLIADGKHVLVAYIMKPKAGYDYLATAAHFAAESSTGTNVNVCTTDDFTKSVDALVYYIDPENEEMKIAYPTMLFDRNITDGRAMMCSVLTLSIGNNQGLGEGATKDVAGIDLREANGRRRSSRGPFAAHLGATLPRLAA